MVLEWSSVNAQWVAERAEVAHVVAEDEWTELGEGEEDNEEHETEADEVVSRTIDGCWQHTGRLGEVEILEQLHVHRHQPYHVISAQPVEIYTPLL